MIYGLYQSAAGMLTHEYRQDVLANNIANADTVGFKRDISTFAERAPEAVGGDREGPGAELLNRLAGGVWLGETWTDFGEGPHQSTHNPLDAALAGPGFFVVQGPDGPQFTRDGRFTVSPDGALVAAEDGAAVLGVGGAPIRVDFTGPQPRLDEEGRVWQRGALAGQLTLANFEDYRALQKRGASRFDAGDATPIPSLARLRNEYVEGSGVQPTAEMVEMISASRAYQLNARMLQLQDESAGRMIGFTARA